MIMTTQLVSIVVFLVASTLWLTLEKTTSPFPRIEGRVKKLTMWLWKEESLGMYIRISIAKIFQMIATWAGVIAIMCGIGR